MAHTTKVYRCFCSNRFCRYYGQPLSIGNCCTAMKELMNYYLSRTYR
jgi:hypothetical protein